VAAGRFVGSLRLGDGVTRRVTRRMEALRYGPTWAIVPARKSVMNCAIVLPPTTGS
jgi:hypothetical protein